jgi:hypothetical protein
VRWSRAEVPGEQVADDLARPTIIRWISDVPSKISVIGLFNGAPDLAERSEEILREEFAKRADADR